MPNSWSQLGLGREGREVERDTSSVPVCYSGFTQGKNGRISLNVCSFCIMFVDFLEALCFVT